jgi:LacI family transcriptional regulator
LNAKRVTSLDVARRAGVSRTTVSFVLNNVAGIQIGEDTRKRVHQAAQDLGYVPDAAAQALASGRSKTIGLLLARRPHLIASDMFLTQIMEVLVRQVNYQGMRLMLHVVEDFEDRESYLKLVRSNSIDGILYSGPRFEDTALLSLVEHGVPTVVMGALPGTNYAYVDVDNRSAAFHAVEHLLQLGHQCIGCITNAKSSYVAASDRLAGYQDALEMAGIPLNKQMIRYGDFDPESGYVQMNNLLETQPTMTAVFVASDVVAFGAMAAVRERGIRIPQDISIIGFDDVPVARYVEPSLTTMRLPVAELARRAGAMVIGMINGEQPEHPQILLDAELLVRKSCCPARV